MGTTRWREKLRSCLGTLHRELRIALAPDTDPEKWLFIVGCYNSGTQLLMHLLDNHPQISSLPEEGQFLTDQLVCDYEVGLPRMWILREDLFRLNENDVGPDPVRLKREWLMRLDRSRAVFVEKSPPNTARTRWLQRYFANAHFLVVVRNGYAVAEGIRRKAEPRHREGPWPIALCARQWARSYEVLFEDAEHLRHMHWLRYEDLVAEPEANIREVLDFLDIDADVSDMELGGAWSVHEREEPIRNMNSESIGRLTPEDVEAINAEAENMLVRMGYALL